MEENSKSQLTAEPPQREEAGAHQKRFTSKDEEESTGRWREGCNQDKIESHTRRWQPRTGEQLYHRSSPTGVRVLAHVRFPSQPGSLATGKGNPQSSWGPKWAGPGLDKTGRNRFHSLEGSHSVSCAPGPRSESGHPTEDQTRPTLLVC